MLLLDLRVIGNRFLSFRKKTGMTQSELAEAAGLSDRAYADIERGTVNMRIETFLKLCNALQISPNDILTDNDTELTVQQNNIWDKLSSCSPHDRATALQLLSVYLQSLEK